MLPKWNLADVRARMFNRPLMVTRDRAEAALGVMGPKLNVGALFVLAGGGEQLSIDQLKAQAAFTSSAQSDLPGDNRLKKKRYDWATDTIVEADQYEIWNGAAILEVRGTLMAEHGIDPSSGATGYDGLNLKARLAADDNRVKGTILDIDSGGGEVVDLLELCTQLRSLAEKKPMRAIIRGTGCSAAYAIAACAGPGNITAAPYSVVGSIGAIMLHADFSKQLEEEGVDVTMITSAPHKADASYLKPLEPDVEARLQAMVSGCASSFIDHVADARAVARSTIEAQEARFYSDQDVLDLGLVDKFMPWDASMREFAEGLTGRSAGSANIAPSGARSAKKGTAMSIEGQEPPAGNQPEIEAAATAARQEGHAAGVTEGATAERERITALAEIDGESTLSASLTTAIAEGTSPGDFAVAQSRAAKTRLTEAAAAAATEAVPGDKLPKSGASANPQAAPVTNRGQAYAEKKQASAS